MIIDCHTHINCPSGSIDTAGHSEACQKVDGCIVLAQRGGSTADNKKVSSYVSGKPEMAGFAVFNPLEDKLTPKYIKSVTSDSGMAGLVLYCCEDKFHPANSRAMCLYESAEQLKMPLFFHNGPHLGADAVLDYAQPYLLDEIARSFPALKIIIGGMGSIPGVVVGALVLIGAPELLREFAEFRYLVFGALLVAMMLTRPEGLWPEARRKLELHEEELAAGTIALAGAEVTSNNPGE